MALYSFIALDGERRTVNSSQLVFTGAWSAVTTYAVYDVATDGLGHNWAALVINTGSAIPSIFDTSTPTTWSHLVLQSGDPISPEDQAIDTANAAYGAAYNALGLAWSGTLSGTVVFYPTSLNDPPNTVLADSSLGNVVMYLPLAAGLDNQKYVLKRLYDGSGNNVDVQVSGDDRIDNVKVYSLAEGQTVTVMAFNGTWNKIACCS
jgi:hypothetical protein